MLLLRTNPPLLLIPPAKRINMKGTEPEHTEQKLGESENSAAQHTVLRRRNCSCGWGKGGRNSCTGSAIRAMPSYPITVCNCIILLAGKPSALQKLLSVFASYPWSRQQLPWPKWKAEDRFSERGGGGKGVSLRRKRRWRKPHPFPWWIISYFFRLAQILLPFWLCRWRCLYFRPKCHLQQQMINLL